MPITNTDEQTGLFEEQIRKEQQRIAEKIANEKNPYKKMAYELQYRYVQRNPKDYFRKNDDTDFSVKKAYEELTKPLI